MQELDGHSCSLAWGQGTNALQEQATVKTFAVNFENASEPVGWSRALAVAVSRFVKSYSCDDFGRHLQFQSPEDYADRQKELIREDPCKSVASSSIRQAWLPWLLCRARHLDVTVCGQRLPFCAAAMDR